MKQNYLSVFFLKRSGLPAYLILLLLSVMSSGVTLAATPITVTIDTGASITLSDADNDDFYEIATPDELYAFMAHVNAGNGNEYINAKLTADIVVNRGVLNADGTLSADTASFRTWYPIGYWIWDGTQVGEVYYRGTFDGNNHIVSGLYLNNYQSDCAGLFGQAEGAVIKNVSVVDSYITGKSDIAGVVGLVKETQILNCHSSATVKATLHSVGGIVGIATVKNGSNNVTTVSECHNTGMLYGQNRVGGIIGYVNCTADVFDCYNSGSITSTGGSVGGIAGETLLNEIHDCYNNGPIDGVSNVGGIVGFNKGGVQFCYNTSSISGKTSIGGITGTNQYAAVLACYNTGSVTASEKYVGGIVGSQGIAIVNCYNTGAIQLTSTTLRAVGAISGNFSSQSSRTNCYYLEGCAKDRHGRTQKGDGQLADVEGSCEKMQEEDFSGGKIACLLQKYWNDKATESEPALIIWGQNIDGEGAKDESPILYGPMVYQNQVGGCCESTYKYQYSNTEVPPVVTHEYVDGSCTWCGEVENATGVESVSECGSNEVIYVTCMNGSVLRYDAAKGRTLPKGVYIIDGKKVLVP